MASTQALLPARSAENDAVVLEDGSLRAVLECSTLAFSLKGEAEQRALAHGWGALLNSLQHPIQLVIRTRRAHVAQASLKQTDQGSARARLLSGRQELLLRMAAGREMVDRRLLLIVPAESGARARVNLGHLFARGGRGDDAVGPATGELLDQRVRWIAEQLGRIGVAVKRLSTGDLTALFHQTLCPGEAETQPPGAVNTTPGWPGTVAPAAFRESPAEVRLGDRLARVLAITAYPQLLRPAWLETLLEFDGDLDLSLHIGPVESQTMMAFLNRRIAELSSTIQIAGDQGRHPDAYRQAALEDATELQQRLARGEERLFEVALYATVWADDPQALEAATKRVEALLGSILVQSRQLLFRMEPGFISTLPLGIDRVRLVRILPTSVLSATFPFSGNDLNASGGLLYGLNSAAKSPVLLDRFDLQNHNSVVFAASGAGKSFLVKVELIRAWLTGIRIVVVDPEGEYASVISGLDGEVVSVRPGAPVTLDPFAVGQEPGALAARVASLVTLIELVAGGLTPNQRAAVEDAVSFTYAERGFTDEGSGDTPEPPSLVDVHEALTRRAARWHGEARMELEQLVLRVQRYVTGSGGWLFTRSAAAAVSPQSDLTAYVMSGLPEEDRAVAMFTVLDRIWSGLVGNEIPTLVVVDEAWWLMQYPDTARFLQRLAKTARKRHAGLTLITQDVGDVLNSPAGEGVVTNAALQVLMRQAPQAIGQLADLFQLTQIEQTWLLNAQQGEGLLLAMGKRVPFKVVASEEEVALIQGRTEAEGEAA